MAPFTPSSPKVVSAGRGLGDLARRFELTPATIAAQLGPATNDALFRGEPAAVRRQVSDDSDLSVLIRALIVRDAIPAQRARDLFGAVLVDELADLGWAAAEADEFRMLVDVRPHIISGRDRLVISDADASMTMHVPGPDHVLGVGAASLSLLQSIPDTPTGSVLDLGTGSGVLALGETDRAQSVTATDVHPRALDFAAATMAANDESVELLEGSWFEPVEGRAFDRIIANPPFVVGPAQVGHVYRDSGLGLDGATKLVVEQAAEHLADDGTAHLLGAWVHTSGQTWEQRVASWIPSHGIEAWVLQRDVADPELYVGTWLRDESIDPRSAEGAARTDEWLDFFAENDVTGIGFGFIAMRRIGDRPSEITAQDLSAPFEDPLGPEVAEYFQRTEWLRGRDHDDIAASRFQVRPTVAREDVSLPDDENGVGFTRAVLRLTRTDGPRFSHEVDPLLADIVAGLHPQGLTLADTVKLLASARGLGEDALLEAAIPAIVDLVRNGLLLTQED